MANPILNKYVSKSPSLSLCRITILKASHSHCFTFRSSCANSKLGIQPLVIDASVRKPVFSQDRTRTKSNHTFCMRLKSGQASKRNMEKKYFFGDFLSAYFWQKL